MLHAWEKYGLNAAQTEFQTKYNTKYRLALKPSVSFRDVVKGKIDYIGMIRGKNNPIYLNFREHIRKLSPELFKVPETALEFLTRTSRTAQIKGVITTIQPAEHVHTLTTLLSSVDANLELKRLGAWQTFKGISKDRLSQSAHSMREVIRLLLDILAPDEKIILCPWYVKPVDPKVSVTRKMRVKYCLSGPSGSSSESTVNYIESLSRFVDESYAKLSNEAHSNTNLDPTIVKAFLDSGELVILMILLNRKS
jgi:hypothetical protein